MQQKNWELYGSGNISDTAAARHNLNLSGLRVPDLRYKKDSGEAWDFSRRADREMALALLEREREPRLGNRRTAMHRLLCSECSLEPSNDEPREGR